MESKLTWCWINKAYNTCTFLCVFVIFVFSYCSFCVFSCSFVHFCFFIALNFCGLYFFWFFLRLAKKKRKNVCRKDHCWYRCHCSAQLSQGALVVIEWQDYRNSVFHMHSVVKKVFNSIACTLLINNNKQTKMLPIFLNATFWKSQKSIPVLRKHRPNRKCKTTQKILIPPKRTRQNCCPHRSWFCFFIQAASRGFHHKSREKRA